MAWTQAARDAAKAARRRAIYNTQSGGIRMSRKEMAGQLRWARSETAGRHLAFGVRRRYTFTRLAGYYAGASR